MIWNRLEPPHVGCHRARTASRPGLAAVATREQAPMCFTLPVRSDALRAQDGSRSADSADPSWAKPDPTRTERFLAARRATEEERRKLFREEQQAQRQHITELRGWWLQRMAHGPRPFQEKMVLFWHGHFATSFEKVKESYLMWRQNELFRRLATGNWLEILFEVAKDPAMLL